MLRPCLPFVLVLFAFPLQCLAEVLLVKPDGTGDFPTIQAAVDAAVDGDEVVLTEGLFTGEGNREVDFLGKAITVRSENGDPGTTGLDLWIDGNSLSRAFILDSNEGPDSVIRDLFIGNGVNDVSYPPRGTITCIDTSPTIANCVFGGNFGPSLSFDGGALTVLGCHIVNNTAIESCTGILGVKGSITIEDCVFSDNHGENSGGGAVVPSGVVRRCSFERNGVGFSGGGLVIGPDTLVEDCSFLECGGVYYGGGAIMASGGTIRRCVFGSNGGAYGGAIRCGGFVGARSDDLPEHIQAILRGFNRAVEPCVIESCAIGNSGWYAPIGEAIYVGAGHLDLSNTIIAFCSFPYQAPDGGVIYLSPDATASISCTDIYGNTDGDWVNGLESFLGQNGNISADPLYCEGFGEHGIDANSPCAPSYSGNCGLIGALPVACSPPGGFSTIPEASFLSLASSTGASFIDLDGDSDLDLHVLRDLAEADVLYRNDGAAGFAAVTSGPLADIGRGEGMDWGDYDNDGLLDVYVVNASTANRLYRNLGGGSFIDVTTPPLNHGFFDQGASWVDYDRDGRLDLYLTTHSANHLYRNLGNGTFVETTPAALALSLDCGNSAWADYDNDGDSDVFVSVQDGADVLARNDGNGAFANVTPPPLANSGLAQGAAWGDYDNDSDLDLYVCAFGQPNHLFRNDGGAFVDVATGNLADAGNSQSGTWADYDNDRDLDLVLTNFGQPNALFRNDAGAFQRLALGAAGDSANSLGAAWGDYDQDGDMDLFTATFGGPDRLYRNDVTNGNNWLEVTLEGTASNRSAIGARITAVDLQSGVTQIREHGTNHGYWSCNQPAEHFGLGTTTRIDFLTIRWPSGAVEVFSDVPANLRLHIIEGGGMVGAPVVPAIPARVLARPNPFREATEILWSGGSRSKAELTIYDVGGRLVRSVAGDVPGGIRWDGREAGGRAVPNGIYFYRIKSGTESKTGKLVRMR